MKTFQILLRYLSLQCALLGGLFVCLFGWLGFCLLLFVCLLGGLILIKHLKNILIADFMKMIPCLISKILYFLLWRELQDNKSKYYNNFWDTCDQNTGNKTGCEVILRCPGTKLYLWLVFIPRHNKCETNTAIAHYMQSYKTSSTETG